MPPHNPPFVKYHIGHSSLANMDVPRRGVVAYNKLKSQEKSVFVAKSAIVGRGLFAGEDIAQEDIILEYQGVRVTAAVARHNRKTYERNGWTSTYQMAVGETGVVVDATLEGNDARFANHHCDNNAYYSEEPLGVRGVRAVFMRAKRPIKAREEVFGDYALNTLFERCVLVCSCESPTCRKWV